MGTGSGDMAQIGADSEPEPFSVDDYQTLLQCLKIHLPEGALSPGVSARATRPEIIRDSQEIVRDLKDGKVTVKWKPRLSCVEVKHASDLKASGKTSDFVRILFFKKRSKASEQTLRERWESGGAEGGCRFRMKDTFQEKPVSRSEKPSTATGAGNAVFRKAFGNPAENRNNESDCFRFYLEQRGLREEDVTYRREFKVESGFISGRLDFLLDVETSQSEKVIIECKGTKGSMVGDVFTTAHAHRAELNQHHDYYLQTQAYLSILQKELNPTSVRAVMVLKVTAEGKEPTFYWGEVRDNTEHMEKLNHFCQEEALPRFLAMLNLIFRKR